MLTYREIGIEVKHGVLSSAYLIFLNQVECIQRVSNFLDGYLKFTSTL